MSDKFKIKLKSSIFAKKIEQVDGWSIDKDAGTIAFFRNERVILLYPLKDLVYLKEI